MKHFLRIQRRFSTRQSSSVQVALGRGLGALLLAAVMTGCGSETGQEFIAEQITEALTGIEDVDIDADNGTISFAMDGESLSISSGMGTQLPEDFPDDILVYDDAEIISVHEASGRSGDVMQVTLSSEADPDGIKTAYLAFFEDHGWQQEGFMDLSGAWTASYSKGERAVSIMLYPPEGDDEPSMLAVTLMEDS